MRKITFNYYQSSLIEELINLVFLVSVWYKILKQLFTSVLVKVVDIDLAA